MKQSNVILIFLCMVFVFSSCTQRLVDFTIISTKNVDLSNAPNFKRGKQRNEGTDRVYWILSIPLGIPNMKEAIDRAIEQTPGAVALVDGVVSSKAMWFILSGYSEYIVEGTPLIDPSLANNVELDSPYNMVSYNKDGEVTEITPLTEAEYNKMKQKIQPKKFKATK